MPRSPLSWFRDCSQALKLEHTVFALPFAYLALWVAAEGNPSWAVVGWVTLAVIAARTAGMCLNRVIDLPMDRINPRTKEWPVSSGKISPRWLLALTVVSCGLFFFSAAQLNPLCFKLAPAALVLLAFYPATKRFTWSCHFWLGLALAAAPLGGWLAVTGRFEAAVFPLAVGVLFWVAGFDILYALLDLDFDRTHGVYSIPQRFGLTKSLVLSGLCHGFALVSFGWFGLEAGLGVWFWLGLAGVAGLLFTEHRLVTPQRLDRVNQAFFVVNGWVSVTLFLLTLLDLKLPGLLTG